MCTSCRWQWLERERLVLVLPLPSLTGSIAELIILTNILILMTICMALSTARAIFDKRSANCWLLIMHWWWFWRTFVAYIKISLLESAWPPVQCSWQEIPRIIFACIIHIRTSKRPLESLIPWRALGSSGRRLQRPQCYKTWSHFRTGYLNTMKCQNVGVL